QASTNAQDGVSAVQTAEGALTEVHSMLQRMNELAVQAANGTNSDTDRNSIQDEINQLTTEIDRVAETTKFNETYLLKGDADGNEVTKTVKAHDAGLDGKLVENTTAGTTKFTLNKKLENGDKVTIAGKEYSIGLGKSEDSYEDKATLTNKAVKVGDSVTVDGKTTTLTNDVKANTLIGNSDVEAANNQIIAKDGTVYEYKAAGTHVTTAGWYDKSTYEDTALYAAQGHMKTTGQIAVEGATLKLNAAQTTSGLKEFNIVENIKDGEKSAFDLGGSGTIKAEDIKGSALSAGDSATISGETRTAVETAFSGAQIKKLADVAKAIGNLQGDKTVTVANIDTTNEVTYKIAETAAQEDSASNTYTRDHIIELLKEGQEVTVDSTKYTVAGVDAADDSKISANRAYTLMADELQKASSIGTDTAAKVQNNNDGSFEITQGTVTYKDKLTFNLHVGADADMTNKINVDVNSMSAASLGIKGINVSDTTGTAATYAIDAIADAVAKVSAQRSALGAVQNRLEHTIANVDNVVENSTAAESRIRDTDMADEMVNYSKNNILAQAGQSMLAQANQSTQGVLSILG
ncbi:flagellin N-terminal helical region, partial [Pseudobutyrivibrio sp. OR37]|uniref:flagellin n=1 Tax=Pseudobutyrivibrio sp. OR37 TaxID=1798186 RepID=UPI0008EFA45A